MEAETFGEFLHRIINHYLNHGFYYYVLWELPEGRNLAKIDEKIVNRYNANQPRWERFNARKKGSVVVRYVRFHRYALLIATDGDRDHLFFNHERWQDVRVNPLMIWRYSLGIKAGKGEVRLQKNRIKAARELLANVALDRHAKVQGIYNQISPFTYRGILHQKYKLAKEVNQRRQRAGLPPINPY